MNYDKLAKLLIGNIFYINNNNRFSSRRIGNMIGPDNDYVAHNLGINVKDKKLYHNGKISPSAYYQSKSEIYRCIHDIVSMSANQKDTFHDKEYEAVKVKIIDIDTNYNKLKLEIEEFEKWLEFGRFRVTTSMESAYAVNSPIVELFIGNTLSFDMNTNFTQMLKFLEITTSGENV